MANDEHLHKAFAYFDENRSGYIEIEELRDSLNDENDVSSDKVINVIMHDFDVDKDGRISYEVDVSSDEVINAIMHDVDMEKDGRISYEEFAEMMKAGMDWRKTSRQYPRERCNTLSLKLMRDGLLTLNN